MPKSSYKYIDPHIGTRKIYPCECKSWCYEKSFLNWYEKRFGIDYFTNIHILSCMLYDFNNKERI